MVRIRRRWAKPKPPNQLLTITQLILEKLLELGEGTLDAFFPAKYPEARLWRRLLGLDASYEFSPRTFSAILSRLRRQGLVAKRPGGRPTTWTLTERGKTILKVPVISDPYSDLPPRDRIPRLVVFDIPERERAKRDALRRELITCDYQPLQKSVWLGYRPLPDDFLDALDDLGVRQYVHMFVLRELGTLGTM